VLETNHDLRLLQEDTKRPWSIKQRILSRHGHLSNEAAAEVARQLRLRNIGGIVVIDFIDMKRRRNRDKVMECLARAARSDHAKIKILPITRLGLVEMTRERRRESLLSMTGDTFGTLLTEMFETLYVYLIEKSNCQNKRTGLTECGVP